MAIQQQGFSQTFSVHWLFKDSERTISGFSGVTRTFCDHIGEVTIYIDPEQLVLLDVSNVIDNVNPLWRNERWKVFQAIQAVTRMMVWTMRMKELYEGVNFSHCDLILIFRYDRKSLDRMTFSKRWVKVVSLIVRKIRGAFNKFPDFFCKGL